MILLIIGISIHIFLFNTLNEIPLIISILYNYSTIDIRFLISLLFNIYYLTLLYKCIFQYLDIDIFMKTRLNNKQKLIFYLKRIVLFTIIYIFMQIIIMLYLNQYPIIEILHNLIYYYICIIISFTSLYKKDYIYVIMVITMTILKIL